MSVLVCVHSPRVLTPLPLKGRDMKILSYFWVKRGLRSIFPKSTTQSHSSRVWSTSYIYFRALLPLPLKPLIKLANWRVLSFKFILFPSSGLLHLPLVSCDGERIIWKRRDCTNSQQKFCICKSGQRRKAWCGQSLYDIHSGITFRKRTNIFWVYKPYFGMCSHILK